MKAGKAAVGSATQAEQAARTTLFGLLAAIRDDVKLGYPDDAPLQEAFGVGQRLTDRATKKLLDAADAVAAAYQDDETDYAARCAGRRRDLRAPRVAREGAAALDDANQAQGTKIGARKGSASDKQSLLAKVKRETAGIRAAAKVALQGRREGPRRLRVRRRPPRREEAPRSHLTPSARVCNDAKRLCNDVKCAYNDVKCVCNDVKCVCNRVKRVCNDVTSMCNDLKSVCNSVKLA